MIYIPKKAKVLSIKDTVSLANSHFCYITMCNITIDINKYSSCMVCIKGISHMC